MVSFSFKTGLIFRCFCLLSFKRLFLFHPFLPNVNFFTGSPETSCQSATTMNLFPPKENNVAPKNLTAMDLLSPQASSYGPSEEIPTLINSRWVLLLCFFNLLWSQLTVYLFVPSCCGRKLMSYDSIPIHKTAIF